MLIEFQLNAGFIQSLEFLYKYGNLQTSFLALEKLLKLEIKSGKNGKSLIFFPFYNKHLIIE